MKSILFIAALLLTSITFAQEGVTVSGNAISIREIPPVWPGCEGSIAEKKACFKKQLVKHVVSNFRFPEGYTKGSVKEKVIVDFGRSKTQHYGYPRNDPGNGWRQTKSH